MQDSRFAIRRLHRAGDSQQITIPKPYLRALGLKNGDALRVYLVGETLCMNRFDEGGFRPGVVPVRSSRSAEA